MSFVFQTLVSHPLDFLVDSVVKLIIPLPQSFNLSSCPLKSVLILYKLSIDLIGLFLHLLQFGHCFGLSVRHTAKATIWPEFGIDVAFDSFKIVQ